MKNERRQPTEKPLRIRRTYEPNRLAAQFLTQAYRKLTSLPVHLAARPHNLDDELNNEYVHLEK